MLILPIEGNECLTTTRLDGDSGNSEFVFFLYLVLIFSELII